jgi:imidazolonepropionase
VPGLLLDLGPDTIKNQFMKKSLFTNISELLTLSGVAKKDGRKIQESDMDIISNAVLVTADDKIIWCGPKKMLPKEYSKIKNEVDMQGRTVLPGFVECHTHAIFAGNRAAEFELRNQGVSYQEIAKSGGGILSTMSSTRKISVADLKVISQKRVDNFLMQGVTTLEIKSGYGLNLKDEIKSLQVAKKMTGPRIVTTFLGAHALPPEFKTATQYLDYLCTEILPIIKKKKLSNRVDVFIEDGFFSKELTREYLQNARALGFYITLHADQLSLSGGADLAVDFKAQSADHLIRIKDEQIQLLAKSDVTCVLLPAADLYLKSEFPPARKLIEAGARVALATDFNPGSSPTQDLSLVGLLARLEMKMTLPEVISAYTFGSAAALGMQSKVGFLAPNMYADFISIDAKWDELFYSAGSNNVKQVFKNATSMS